jgi:D-aminopeptidase
VKNLITDVPGLRVGAADDARLASGVSVVLFDEPAAAGMAAIGGAPALRDGALLAPEMTIDRVDAFVLSGGSAFGLDASGGVMAHLAALGRGFARREARVPIVPGASLFDLTHGGDKKWGRRSPYGDLGYAAVESAGADFALGTAGAGYGAWTYDLKGERRGDPARISGRRLTSALANSAASGRASGRRTRFVSR